MANRLKMVAVETIVSLLVANWPQRKIARELGISRDAVRHYAKLLRLGKLSVVMPPGWPGLSSDQSAEVSTGLLPGDPAAPPSDSNCTTRPSRLAGIQNLPGAPPGSDGPKPPGVLPGSTRLGGRRFGLVGQCLPAVSPGHPEQAGARTVA